MMIAQQEIAPPGAPIAEPRRGYSSTSTVSLVPGFLALAATVVIWASFALSARALAASTLTAADAALLRFAVPLVILAPLLWKRRKQFTRLRWAPALKVVCGGGVPFFLASMFGASLTSAAFVSALIPGLVPLFVSASMVAAGRRLPRGFQRFGLALIAIGAVTLITGHLAGFDTGFVTGCGMLVIASGLWALYTVGLHEISLDPIGSIGLLCAPSVAAISILVLTDVLPAHLLNGRAAWSDIILFAVVQGVAVGVLSAFCYAFAIRRVGAQRSATIGSLSPALTSVLAIPLLAEPLTLAILVGIPLITSGVILANRPAQTKGAPCSNSCPAKLNTPKF